MTEEAPTHTTPEQTPDLRRELFGAQRWCVELVTNVDETQLADATPCTEFDVRQLMAHIALGCEKVETFGRLHRDPRFGQDLSPADYARVGEELAETYVDGLTPTERGERLTALIDAAEQAWPDELLDTPMQLAWGPHLPGRDVLGIYLMEAVAHGWDLASPTGQNPEAPDDVARAALAAAKAGLPESSRGMDAGVPFGPVVVSRADAGLTEQMANWTGRRWSLS